MKVHETNEAEVYFALYGDEFDPDAVTRMVGIEPTSIKRKKDPIPKHTWWRYSLGKIENDVINIYDMSAALIAVLQPHQEKIAQVKTSHSLNAVLSVVLWITCDETISTPAIGFDENVISFLNTVGATIDIDTYRN